MIIKCDFSVRTGQSHPVLENTPSLSTIRSHKNKFAAPALIIFYDPDQAFDDPDHLFSSMKNTIHAAAAHLFAATTHF
jgi:hypothetical protein